MFVQAERALHAPHQYEQPKRMHRAKDNAAAVPINSKGVTTSVLHYQGHCKPLRPPTHRHTLTLCNKMPLHLCEVMYRIILPPAKPVPAAQWTLHATTLSHTTPCCQLSTGSPLLLVLIRSLCLSSTLNEGWKKCLAREHKAQVHALHPFDQGQPATPYNTNGITRN